MSVGSLTRAALAAPALEHVTARARLFGELGWRVVQRGRGDAAALSLVSGGVPRVFVTSVGEPAGAVSLGYSNEAVLTLAWSSESLRLTRSEIWSETPGDTAIVSVSADDDVGARHLIDALARDRLGGLLQAPQLGTVHRRLADELASAFARLRLEVASANVKGIAEQDVFQFFHQLLFVRFHEDRFGPVDEAGTVSQALSQEDPVDRLVTLLAAYSERFDSELFGQRAPISLMPIGPVLSVVRAMVEPWQQLRLNFSVTSSDVAGRLYQSFLASAPAVDREGRLFPVAIPIDRQRERGAFYTPQPLAELVAERCLGEVLRAKTPKTPAEIRVLDPACGSGAFLLAAYRVLSRYFEEVAGGPLSEEVHLAILRDSLYGGDDDETATALTRIQLLEEAGVDKRRLPLLRPTIGTADLLALDSDNVPPGWREALAAGGFDVVLSNPPFHSPRSAQRAGFDTTALSARFSSARGTGWNIAAAFFEAGLRLVAERGRMAMIVPQAILDGPSGRGLRESVGHGRVTDVIDFGRNELFAPTMAYVAAVTVAGAPSDGDAKLTRVSAVRIGVPELVEAVSQSDVAAKLSSAAFTVVVPKNSLAETDSWSPFVVRWHDLSNTDIGAPVRWVGAQDAPHVAIGTQTGDDSRFVLGPERWEDVGKRVLVDGRFHVPREFAPFWVSGSDVRPFSVGSLTQRVIVPQMGEHADVDRLIEYLGGTPPSFRPGNLGALRGPKVVVRGLFDEPAAVADKDGVWMIPQGGAGGIAVVGRSKSDVLLLECLLNSSLYQWILQGLGHSKSRGFVQVMRHHWRFVPWPSLSRDERRDVIVAGEKVRAALRSKGPEAPSRYWNARVGLDSAVYKALGITPALQATVASELWRRP